MSVNTSSRLGLGLEASREQAEEERAKKRRPEDWAFALAQSVAAKIPPAWQPIPESPGGWRGVDNSLTARSCDNMLKSEAGAPAAGTRVGGATETASENGDDGRLSLTVDAGELGELSLIVDRTKAGVRVTIGVADQRAVAAVGPERAALERALFKAGLSVESVSVVAQATGTVFAQTPKARTLDSAQRAPNHDESDPHRKRTQRRLNLIG